MPIASCILYQPDLGWHARYIHVSGTDVVDTQVLSWLCKSYAKHLLRCIAILCNTVQVYAGTLACLQN